MLSIVQGAVEGHKRSNMQSPQVKMEFTAYTVEIIDFFSSVWIY